MVDIRIAPLPAPPLSPTKCLLNTIEELQTLAAEVKNRVISIVNDMVGDLPSEETDESPCPKGGTIGTAKEQIDSIREYLNTISTTISRI